MFFCLFALIISHSIAEDLPPFLKSKVPVPSIISGPFLDDEMPSIDSICNGTDNSRNARCYARVFSRAYLASRPVLRITKNGRAHCTGFLVGNQGHILTNWHCARTASDVASLNFEAMAEGPACGSNCRSPLACAGRMVNTAPVSFITTGGSLTMDYTLLRLARADREVFHRTLGHLRLRWSGARVGERIFIPQYPRGYGKQIATFSGSQRARIVSITTGNFNRCGDQQVSYVADTQGGSSGSPVISFTDYRVVALHHCGGCSTYANTGVNVRRFAFRLWFLLPRSAFF